MNSKPIFLAFLFWALALHTDAQNPLLQNFQSPPNAAKPRVWWHWMNGNITKEGIQKDLEWMDRVGIGGFQNFDASLFTPQIVKDRLIYMTPAWKDAFKFTTNLADKLGLEMAIAASPGWSVTGGPWVLAKNGMKKYVWSETRVVGTGRDQSIQLPHPPSNSGTFQNIKLEDDFAVSKPDAEPKNYYADAAVVAYKIPETDKTLEELNPKITSSGGTFDLKTLTDGDLNKSIYLPPTAVGENAWIQFEFSKPQTFKALTIVGGGGGPNFGFFGGGGVRTLVASDDGMNFKDVLKIPVSGIPQNTVTFAPTTAKYFRVLYKTLQPQPNPFASMAGMPQDKLEPKGTDVTEIVLHTSSRIERLEEKAAFTTTTTMNSFVTPETSDPVSKNDVIDVSAKMNADGKLNWNAPAGNWNIVRIGYSLTGRQNHPASPEATGLEVDKLDAQAVTDYLENYLDQYKDATGGLMGKKGLQCMVTDSYEAGSGNWTGNLMSEFAKRRGYSMINWLPVLTGHIVGSTEESEKFLFDYRTTLGDLIVENHYDLIGELLHKRGMLRYTESHEDKRVFVGDGMAVKRKADVPMAAMWTPGSLGGSADKENVRHSADIRESASVAHLYGQNLVAAESMTAIGNTWAYSPERLKRTADAEMAAGLNRFVIHTSVHQPVDDKIPGLGLGPFGQWFTRHETWAEYAKPWATYLARSCNMLQQGKAVVDVLYYYGEDDNITSLFGAQLPNMPKGYEYDFVNADALLNLLSVKDGKIVTPSGMSYRVLVLDEHAKKMSLPVLKKIGELVKAGAFVTGIKPESSPSLSDDKTAFQNTLNSVYTLYNDRVRENADMSVMLSMLKILPDFSYTCNEDNMAAPDFAKVTLRDKSDVLYVHRQLPDQDIYWLDNRHDRVEDIVASFRVSDKVPELWNPQTGETQAVDYQIKDGRTIIPLHFESWDAYFIVFREKATLNAYTKLKTVETKLLTISNPWAVSFQENRGAPKDANMASLQSLTENAIAGIKYFSGTASYKTTFTMPKIKIGTIVEMDLGDVKNIAEVILNGKPLGVVWKKPFKVNLTGAVKVGENALEVKVTNLWVNRLIGDAQPDVKTKITYTTMPFYRANDPLLPSGLMGPVVISKKQ